MAELKECPFCGCKEQKIERFYIPFTGHVWAICCPDCGVMTHPSINEQIARKRWNLRRGERTAAREAETPRGCFNCEYSREGHQTLRCFGQKGAPEVRPEDLCEAWLQVRRRE